MAETGTAATWTGTAAQCEFCDQQATTIVKPDTFAHNVPYGYLVCNDNDCIADAGYCLASLFSTTFTKAVL